MTKGREVRGFGTDKGVGVQNPEILADVICACPLFTNLSITENYGRVKDINQMNHLNCCSPLSDKL